MTLIEAIRKARKLHANYIAIDKDNECYSYTIKPNIAINSFYITPNTATFIGYISIYSFDWQDSLIKLNDILVK